MRLWSSGFELQSVTNGVEWDTLTGGGSISTAIKRSGAASLRLNPTNGNYYLDHRFASTTSVYARAYVRFASWPDAEAGIFYAFGDYVDSFFSVTSDGNLRFNANTGSPSYAMAQLGEDQQLTLNTWYRIELYQNSLANNWAFKARLDGVEFASSTPTLPSTANIYFIECNASTPAGTNVTIDVYFDDIAVNNTTGDYQNSWPGEGSIIHMHPNGAGDAAATTGTYEDIDEVTPDTATYIQKDTTGDCDYAFQSWAEAGGSAGDAISLVSLGTRQHPESASSAAWKCYIKSEPGGGKAEAASATTHNDTTWKSFGDAAPRTHKITSYVDPETSAAWTPTTLGTMVAGVNVTDASPHMFFSTIWALVEYVTGGAATTSTSSSTISTSSSSSSTVSTSSSSSSSTVSTSSSSSTVSTSSSSSSVSTSSSSVSSSSSSVSTSSSSSSVSTSSSSSSISTSSSSVSTSSSSTTVSTSSSSLSTSSSSVSTSSSSVSSSTSSSSSVTYLYSTSSSSSSSSTISTSSTSSSVSVSTSSTSSSSSISVSTSSSSSSLSTSSSSSSSTTVSTSSSSLSSSTSVSTITTSSSSSTILGLFKTPGRVFGHNYKSKIERIRNTSDIRVTRNIIKIK